MSQRKARDEASIKIACVQMEPVVGRKDDNVRRSLDMIEEAAEKTRTLSEVERAYILRVLEKTAGNKYQAAHALGIDRKTLYRKLAEIEGKPHPEE